jgi:hypothetical protein
MLAWMAVQAHLSAAFVAAPLLIALVATDLQGRRFKRAAVTGGTIAAIIFVLQMPFLINALRNPEGPMGPAAAIREAANVSAFRIDRSYVAVVNITGEVLARQVIPWHLEIPTFLAGLIAAVRWRRDPVALAVSIGALGCSMMRGALPSGIAMPCAARKNARLPNIAGPVDVDHAAGRGRRCINGQPADDLGDLVGRSDTAKRYVRDYLRAATALQIFRRHLRYGETRGDAKAEDAIPGVAARDGLGHADQRGLGCRVMPMLGAVAAKSGAAGDVDDAAAPATVEEMRDGQPA